MTNLFKPRTIALVKMAKLPQYQHPALLSQQFKKSMELQRQQIEGQVPFQKSQYHSPAYETLVKALVQTRKSYRQSTILDTRLQTLTTQFSYWENYIAEGVKNLPEDKKIDDRKRDQIYQAYTVCKQRKEDKIACSRLLNFHDQYAKTFTWDIQLHPKIIMQMVHPHFGYLLNYDRKVTLQQLQQFYHKMLFASQERYLGQTLHSDEISAFNFWKLWSTESHLKLSSFCEFLKAFKFQTSPQTFGQQFQYTLKRCKGELWENGKTDQVIRFDLFRNIFLDRGL